MKNKLSLTLSAFLGATISILFSHFFFNNTSKIINKSEVQDIQQNVQGKEINEEDFKVVNSNLNPIVPKEMDFTKAAEKTVNSVVHIISEYSQTYSSDPLMDFFWGPGGSRGLRSQIATGSGVIISDDGYIVTNNHVIDDADKISITLNDGRELNANLIGTDPSTDLALLKIDENNLPFTSFGNSDDVHLGDWVLAVGNPFNLTSTVTAGIVSAKERVMVTEDDRTLTDMIQTDAAINEGNSGGPLVNLKGELVGINSTIMRGAEGIGFAISSDLVERYIDDLLKFGEVQIPKDGIEARTIDSNLLLTLCEYGYNVCELDENLKGIVVLEIEEGSPSDKSGVIPGDIILSISEKPIRTNGEYISWLYNFRPGEKINLTILRENQEIEVAIELDKY